MSGKSKSANEAVAEWLNRGGYPLEMRAVQVLRELGYYTTQSDYYTDPVTKQNREIDIIATVNSRVRTNFLVGQLVFECKRNEGHPLVVFADNHYRHSEVTYQQQTLLSRHMSALLDTFPLAGGDPESLNLFKSPVHVGYAATTAFRTSNPNDNEGKDIAFIALNGVTAASVSKMKQSDADRSTLNVEGDDRPWRFYQILIPVVLVSDKLFSGTLGDDGKIAVEEIQFANVFWHRHTDSRQRCAVWIVTEAGLPALAENLKASLRELFDHPATLELLKSNSFLAADEAT